MENIIIISATSQTNLKLSNEISEIICNKNYRINILNLEKLDLPLFNPTEIEKDKYVNSKEIIGITDLLVNADGIIICAPEYNGNIPPVISNAIAWVSVTTEYWKDGFKNKHFFISSSSGGEAINFQKSMTLQLEYLGGIVYNEKIIINSKNKTISEKSIKDLKDFLKLL